MSAQTKYIPQGTFSVSDTSYQGQVKVNDYNDEHIVNSTLYTKYLFKDPTTRTKNYLKNLFPFIDWVPHYFNDINWVLSDFITGVTVAIVLVPQSMSYAKLANLAPEFGLYSAFVGLIFYFLFATSREICIGPVAVLSTIVGKIVTKFQKEYGNEYSANEIATTLALISGGIVLGIGLLRLGFIVEFLSLPAILAFTTGSAFNIVCGQLAGLMGFSKKAGKHPTTYQTLIAFLQHLPDTTVDAAFGLTGLFILYLWQFICDYLIEKNKHNKKKRLAYTYLLNLRTAFVIIISTCISFGVLRYHPKKGKTPYSIIGNIPSGLKHLGVFHPPSSLVSKLASELPICTIVLVLEHISISKSFARLNGYKVNPNQEFVAIGLTNMVGTFFGAYPVTGSFSRTALSAKCGVKTPFKALFSGACVLLAIYCFTSAFYYIPNATLSAIIIHCVTNLLANYKITTKLYMFSPIDFIIFIVGVFITVFASIEDGIYWAGCASAANLLWGLCFPNGSFLGRAKISVVRNPILVNGNTGSDPSFIESENSIMNEYESKNIEREVVQRVTTANQDFIYKWVPLPNDSYNSSLIHTRYINNSVTIENPPSSVLVYRMSENFVYTNCSLQIDQILYKIRDTYRPFDSQRERLWCEYSFNEKNWNWSWNSWKQKFRFSNLKNIFDENTADSEFLQEKRRIDEAKPILKVVHLDFSQVVAIDSTSIQSLLDLQNSINNYVGYDWKFHFSGMLNPWVLRGLINAGFGSDKLVSKSPENEYLKKSFSWLNIWKSGNKKKESDVSGTTNTNAENNNLETVHSHLEYHNAYSQYQNAFDEEIEVVVDDNENDNGEGSNPQTTLEINETTFNGDLEVGINNDGTLSAIYNTEYPYFFLDIPSYSEYD